MENCNRSLVKILLTILLVLGCGDQNSPTAQTTCPGSILADLNLPPEIRMIGLHAGDNEVRGIVNNVDAQQARVVLWAKTDIWYVQPYVAEPYTLICDDGSWENLTHPWNQLAALLVDPTRYTPGSTRREHPASAPGVLAWDEYSASDAQRALAFSGYQWTVKTGDRVGPGPNYFSDSDSNVWVDGDGLHLSITQRDGRWYCAEVVLEQSLGYGTYTFQVGSRVDAFDPQTVFAGFLYESDEREIDIEFSQTLAQPDNAQYVVQPYTHAGNLMSFALPAVTSSTHRIVWRSDRIHFTSWRGSEEEPDPVAVIHSWTYTGPDIPPPGSERMRFNLWLFQGKPPEQRQGNDALISSFRYQP